MGRLLAHSLAQSGWDVHLFDKFEASAQGSCAYTAAAMIAPVSELTVSDPEICWLGIHSLPLWRELIEELPLSVPFNQNGTLVIAHGSDRQELDHFQSALKRKWSEGTFETDINICENCDVEDIEPELADRFKQGIFLPDEACLDNRKLLRSLLHALEAGRATISLATEVEEISPHRVKTAAASFQFDVVIDARGLWARNDLHTLRGVRGEIIIVKAPEVRIQRAVRLLHPRYPLYVAPRPDNTYVVGATTIEADDTSPVTVLGALELLSSLYSIHTGFSNASITEMSTNCRPAFPHNQPRVQLHAGLIRINGLYRHGFLVAPKMVAEVVSYLCGRSFSPQFAKTFVEGLKCA